MKGAFDAAARNNGERRDGRPLQLVPLPPSPSIEPSQSPSSETRSKDEKSQTSLKQSHHRDTNQHQHDDCPKVKRRKVEVHELLESLKSMEPNDQLELWKRMIEGHPFDLEQLRFLLTAIDNRIKLDIVSAVPYEIALYIMSFLSPEDLCRAAQVCRSWRIVCEDNRLWREKCNEENLLNDELTMDVIFRRRIKRSHHVQEEFVKKFNSAVPRSEYKFAYLNHINILRNWRTRNLDIPEPLVWHLQPQQPNPRVQVAQQLEDTDGDRLQQSYEQQQSSRNQGCNFDDPNQAPISPSSQNNTINNDVSHIRRYKMRLRCHEDFVITCLQYNPKSGLIVSGSDDQTLKVWSSETGQCIATLEGHTGGVWSSQLTEDDIVISGATDRTVRIWRARTGELLHILYGHTSTVRCLAANGGLVVSGSRDATLRLWNIESGNCQHVFLGHSEAVRCVEFRDGIIVSGSYDHLVMVWDAATGNCIHALHCHSNRIYTLQFDGKIIASGSLDSAICLWDANTGKLRHMLRGHTNLISKMLLKGNVLVSVDADGNCKIWDVETGRCLRTLGQNDQANKHTSALTSVYFDDRHVVTSSDDGTVKLWDANTGLCIRNLVTLPSAANGGVVWRIRASYTKLICAVGSRMQTEDTHLLVLDFDD